MRNKYSVVYLRQEFNITKIDRITDLGLMVDFSGGFIAYLNGAEVVRAGVEKGRGKDASGITRRDAGRHVFFSLKDFDKYLKEGSNVLAIEAHSPALDSYGFSFDPWLIVED